MKDLRDLEDLTIHDIQPIGDAAASLRRIEVCLAPTDLIPQRVFVKSFCRSQLPHKSVNLSFTITDLKNKLTDLVGN